MAYTKKTWYNKSSQNRTPVNATNMNNLETRIKNGVDGIDILATPTNAIIANDDLNNFIDAGTFRCNTSTIANSLLNCPHKNSAFKLIVMKIHDDSRYTQIIIASDNTTSIYIRNYGVNGWTSWAKITSTVI